MSKYKVTGIIYIHNYRHEWASEILYMRIFTHMWRLIWAQKNSFLVSMSTMYLNFGRWKTHFETVVHTLLVSKSQRSVLSMVRPKRQCSDSWSIFAPFRMRSSGKGDNWCFCLLAIVINLVLIGLMTIWLLSHQMDTWSKLFCVLLLICIIYFSRRVQYCVICQHVTINRYIFHM